eukprot:GFYU01002244.1.p2 GENE.GFYU01002244.1~~GFYU01002244.1.p2  ORF type:complete len:122 (-),score=8.82 GFYU01002244.1:480-845(-)
MGPLLILMQGYSLYTKGPDRYVSPVIWGGIGFTCGCIGMVRPLLQSAMADKLGILGGPFSALIAASVIAFTTSSVSVLSSSISTRILINIGICALALYGPEHLWQNKKQFKPGSDQPYQGN